MDIFTKFKTLETAFAHLSSISEHNPFGTTIEKMISATIGIINGKETLLFGTNNYLGLSQSDAARHAAADAAMQYGVGTTGSRIANGTYSLHQELEQDLAKFFNRRSCMVFSTGYQATLGMVSTLAGKDDYLFLDADCHASIYDGSRMSQAQIIRFRHNDADDLRKRMRRLGDIPGIKLVVVEGVYSMFGDVIPLKEFAQVKREENAYLMIDEAHSFGIFGEHGRGIAERDQVEADIDFTVGTFSKSLGTVGGYCVSDHPQMDLLRLCTRPYMFTASLPPEVIAATKANLEIIKNHPELMHKLMDNASRFYHALQSAGFLTGPDISSVISVILEDLVQASRFWNRVLELGAYINLSLPPATPDSRPLLRASIAAAHTTEQIDKLVQIYIQAAQDVGVPLKKN
ncbi:MULTISPECIES: serine palmitoyltransferase [Commensalibacter]|uniref:2-amino-3-ketobutyrate CoA ligase n=2 Tax=Commensalibacter TaxID=1079922 RepID=W7E3V0_9PROT|nr:MULTISPECIES: aminotransferase class I/II-fold pyridoxal phosphate-dependent enzyme [Commensalibacter]EUK17716.1 2-amino-3-ketobutyrate CoA ligase [Commensalibacter papalotli (ex Servin-Garciduenas et al. 2014)]CAI3945285.1 7-keto-8-aminopelargonate synthetase or related enzyme (BioF) (PDB:1BS0) [Commensalibacter papalotli (ex Botero et al. 2024)]CAI3945568.1 7-keto-8-aminopelargonate synthetase or related enzyme (BioF) (PDB:1BS0) [Commensalibacter papalotli (ex Botero et al. 2024)]